MQKKYVVRKSKNYKSIIFISLLIIFLITIYVFSNQFNTKKILDVIQSKTNLKITLVEKNIWKFYPFLSIQNKNINIRNQNNSLVFKNTSIEIIKSYWPTSPFSINLKSPIINYKGIEMRNADLTFKYKNNSIDIENLAGDIIQGNLFLKGKIDLNNNSFKINGYFENISLNSLLKQSKIGEWDRVNIMLSSPNFNLSSSGNEQKNLYTSVIGTVPIKGSLYFGSTDEERFGAALLSILVEKFPELRPASNTVNFVFDTYANTPSFIEGMLDIKDGTILTEKITIKNEIGKSEFKGEYNFIQNIINGSVYFYENNKIFLEGKIKGAIENPEIFIGGKAILDHKKEPIKDIKQLLEKGINSFIEKLLSKDE